MRSLLFSAAMLATGGILAGCPAHGAFGPDGDARLEAATSNKASAEGAAAAEIKCGDITTRLRSADEHSEGERLKLLTAVFKEAKERANTLDEAIARNPDLVFTHTGDTVKANQDECRTTLADATSTLDRSIRDVADLPVIQEVQGNKTVPVPRMEFDLVREAIATLAPDDKDVLLSKVDAADKKVMAAKKK